MRASHRHGFTLIELSIVLVIIGLVVGGILVGRDLIRAAEIRAQVSQIEKFNTAANTFKLKYGGLPGDLPASQTSAFGFWTFIDPTMPWGNGNGLVLSDLAGDLGIIRGESPTFWIHLAQAGLISDYRIGLSYSEDGQGSGWSGVLIPADETAPRAKLGRDNHIMVYAGPDAPDSPFNLSLYGLNYFHIYAYTAVDASGRIWPGSQENGITPIEAYGIDLKLDDGRPDTGKVVTRAVWAFGEGGFQDPNSAPSAAATSTAGNCNIGDGTAPTDTFNLISSTGGNEPTCSLRIRAAF